MVNKKNIPDSLKKAFFYWKSDTGSMSYVFINQTNEPKEASSRYEKKKTKIPSCKQVKKNLYKKSWMRKCEFKKINISKFQFHREFGATGLSVVRLLCGTPVKTKSSLFLFIIHWCERWSVMDDKEMIDCFNLDQLKHIIFNL